MYKSQVKDRRSSVDQGSSREVAIADELRRLWIRGIARVEGINRRKVSRLDLPCLTGLAEAAGLGNVPRAESLTALLEAGVRRIARTGTESDRDVSRRIWILYGLEAQLSGRTRLQLREDAYGGMPQLSALGRDDQKARKARDQRAYEWRQRVAFPALASALLSLEREGSLAAPPAERPRTPFDLGPRPGAVAGRSTDIERALRSRAAVQVISGHIGIGKTAFARELAWSMAHEFAGGVLEIDGRASRPGRRALNVEDVMSSVLRRLGVQERDIPVSPALLRTTYRSHLAESPILVLLDDFDEAASVLELVPPWPSRLLVTSRRAMPTLIARVDAEAIRLAGLSTSAGVELLGRILGTNMVQADLGVARDFVRYCAWNPQAIVLMATLIQINGHDSLRAAFSEEMQHPGGLWRELPDTELSLFNLVDDAIAIASQARRRSLVALATSPLVYFDRELLIEELGRSEFEGLVADNWLTNEGWGSFQLQTLARQVIRGRANSDLKHLASRPVGAESNVPNEIYELPAHVWNVRRGRITPKSLPTESFEHCSFILSARAENLRSRSFYFMQQGNLAGAVYSLTDCLFAAFINGDFEIVPDAIDRAMWALSSLRSFDPKFVKKHRKKLVEPLETVISESVHAINSFASRSEWRSRFDWIDHQLRELDTIWSLGDFVAPAARTLDETPRRVSESVLQLEELERRAAASVTNSSAQALVLLAELDRTAADLFDRDSSVAIVWDIEPSLIRFALMLGRAGEKMQSLAVIDRVASYLAHRPGTLGHASMLRELRLELESQV